jgi:hypothetical protein
LITRFITKHSFVFYFIFIFFFNFVFCNIFVTGFPAKFGLLSLGRVRQRQCRAYPGHWGNRTLSMVEEAGLPGGNHRYMICAENPYIRCNISSAASWYRTHTPHRHWLQACTQIGTTHFYMRMIIYTHSFISIFQLTSSQLRHFNIRPESNSKYSMISPPSTAHCGFLH